jgi:hypothetical protein
VIASATKAVVASLVELSPALGVGAVGVPVNAGEASGALAARSVVRFVIFACGSAGMSLATSARNVGGAEPVFCGPP